MKGDDEMEVWRMQWQSQTTIPIDLIRKVERETVYLRMSRLLQIAPILVGLGTIIAAAVTREVTWVLLAVGTWIFIAIGLRFIVANERDIWAPVAETTAAYLELCIRRSQRKLNDIRFGSIMAFLLTAFVLVADYQILKNYGKVSDYDFLGFLLMFAIVMPLVLSAQAKKRRKIEAELAYLENLQREMEKRDN